MNKTQLIDAVAQSANVSKGEARRCVEAFIEIVSDTLEKNDKVVISGFGTFVVTKKQGRLGRDPRNGNPIRIAARNVAKFRPSQELSDRVR